jgi:hypothetical protein
MPFDGAAGKAQRAQKAEALDNSVMFNVHRWSEVSVRSQPHCADGDLP